MFKGVYCYIAARYIVVHVLRVIVGDVCFTRVFCALALVNARARVIGATMKGGTAETVVDERGVITELLNAIIHERVSATYACMRVDRASQTRFNPTPL